MAEKDADKKVEAEESEYGTFEPTFEDDAAGDVWVKFARDNPQEFLKIIIDDFAGLRLIQALLIGGGIALCKGTFHKRGDHAAQTLGAFAGVSVFCNLLGIILAFAVTGQCSGMRSFRASGEEVVAVIPKLFMLFYVAMLSFLTGMICIGCAVLILLSTSQTWAMCIFMCVMAAGFLAIFFFVMTSYKFGNSLPTHAATLAYSHVGSYDLEAAKRHANAAHGAAQAGASAAHGAATRKEGDGSEDAPEGSAKESATKDKGNAKRADKASEEAAADAAAACDAAD